MRLIIQLVWLLSLGALLGACAAPSRPGAREVAERAPTPTSSAAPTPTSTAAPTPTPTAAPAPTSTAAPTPTSTAAPTPTAAPAALRFSYPIGWPGRAPADGFYIRDAYASENTWYNPGYWHTAEDWYSGEGDTAGAEVYAIGAGSVAYVGANYPGRVVIIRHADDVLSMYGHLDPQSLGVAEGQAVDRGTLLGQVLRRSDAVPNHLHFEVRTFLTAREVNGAQPRYPFRCGPSCPPGPGYWPIDAPDHPGSQGWRNPTHSIARLMAAPDAPAPLGTVIVPSWPAIARLELWSAPPGQSDGRQQRGDLAVQAGQTFPLLGLQAGPADSRGSSAEAYELWYRVGLPGGGEAWAAAAIPAAIDRGSDGRPASLTFQLIPAASATP